MRWKIVIPSVIIGNLTTDALWKSLVVGTSLILLAWGVEEGT